MGDLITEHGMSLLMSAPHDEVVLAGPWTFLEDSASHTSLRFDEAEEDDNQEWDEEEWEEEEDWDEDEEEEDWDEDEEEWDEEEEDWDEEEWDDE
jgi:hypothetical protein